MARCVDGKRDYKARIIEAEIARHRRETQRALERNEVSMTNAPEETARKHLILGDALEIYMRRISKARDRRDRLSDIEDLVNHRLKCIEEGKQCEESHQLLKHIKCILERSDEG